MIGSTGDPAASSRPERIGRYEVLGEIARGGMGVVYRARDVQIGREVALKVMLGTDPEEQLRFHQEAQSAGSLRHPNIVAVFDAGLQAGQPYLVMDLVEGESLSQVVERDGPLDVATAARLTERLAQATAYAHDQGVIHRDIKPANVLLDRRGEPLLTDFGLAKAIDAGGRGLTVTGVVLGTPSYMAPEQALGDVERIGPVSDVYGLGATLYELLSGRPPFEGSSALGIMAAVLDQEPAALRRLRPEVHVDLETICLKCMEKEPARRYASAEALADDLGRFVRHEPILARPPSAIQRAGRFLRRHRVAFAAFSLGLALAIGVGVWLSGSARELARLRVELDEAIAAPAEPADRIQDLCSRALALQEQPREKARLLYQRGLARQDLARPHDAIADFERAQTLDPSLALEDRCAEAYARRGIQELNKGGLETGLKDLRRALELNPMHLEASYQSGAALLELGRADEALPLFDRCIEAYGSDRVGEGSVHRAKLLWRRARAKEALGDLQGALGDASASIALDSRDPAALRARADVRAALGDLPGALQDAESALTLDAESPLGHYQRGVLLAKLGREAEALAAFDRCLQRSRFAPALVARGLLHQALGDSASALADANAALELEGHDERALLLRARVLVRERPEEALEDCGRVLATNPKSVRAHYLRGATLVRMGRTDDGESELRQALSLDPDDGGARLALATLAHARATADDSGAALAEASRNAERIVLTKPEDGSVHRAAKELLGRIEETWRVREGAAGQAAMLRAMADEAQGLGYSTEAEELSDRALSLDPNDARALLLRGQARLARGDHDRALADFQHVLRIHPLSTWAMVGSARVFLARGQTSAALTEVTRALQCIPVDHGLRPEAEALLREVQAARAAEQQR